MTLIKLEPLEHFENLGNKVHRIFGEFPSNFNYQCSFSPKIDISEDEKNIYLEAELPGLKKEDINIKMENDTLTIKGEKKLNNEKKEKSVILNERIYGSFERSFALQEDINSSEVTAEYENGVLKIILEKMKKPEAKELQIQVK